MTIDRAALVKKAWRSVTSSDGDFMGSIIDAVLPDILEEAAKVVENEASSANNPNLATMKRAIDAIRALAQSTKEQG